MTTPTTKRIYKSFGEELMLNWLMAFACGFVFGIFFGIMLIAIIIAGRKT